VTVEQLYAWCREHPVADEIVLSPVDMVELTNDVLTHPDFVGHWHEDVDGAIGAQVTRVRRPDSKRSVRVKVVA